MKPVKKAIKAVYSQLVNALRPGQRLHSAHVIAPGISGANRVELLTRFAFYLPEAVNGITWHDDFETSMLASAAPILLFGAEALQRPAWLKLRGGVFDVDQRRNPMDGWAWCEASTFANGTPDLAAGARRFFARAEQIKALGLKRCYLFGTGPSLANAGQRSWDDGIRIVCNTIVRDAELFHHIQPHMIVAGDAIYHFGFTEFAVAFRRDLEARMAECDVLFVYPDYFDAIVQRQFGRFADRLVPIPTGMHSTVHHDMRQEFSTPALGNVLNKLLLPVGCNLSRRIGLWGFDGRAPKDQLFWANSARQSYTELLPTLQAAHPAFFDHFVPKANPEQYVQSVHGDVLEYCLSTAEAQGWQFEMLHHSWTPTLAKRMAAGSALGAPD